MVESFFIFYALSVVLGCRVILDGGVILGGGGLFKCGSLFVKQRLVGSGDI